MSSNIRLNKICQYCSQQFIAKTTVTKFCSDNCAKRSYKVRKRNEKLNNAISWAIKPLPTAISEISYKEFLNINEVCKLLGSSRWTIYRLIKNGELAAGKVGSRTIIPRKSIDNLFNRSV